MTTSRQLPDISQVLAPVVGRVPADQRPLLIAYAERLAAERYRGWASKVTQPDRKASMLACAEREEEIARRIEALYPNAPAQQRELLAQTPELPEINRTLFAPYSLEEQFTLQARGERIGAATWRAFAERAENSPAREVFLACAVLEEESAEFLESIAGGK